MCDVQARHFIRHLFPWRAIAWVYLPRPDHSRLAWPSTLRPLGRLWSGQGRERCPLAHLARGYPRRTALRRSCAGVAAYLLVDCEGS